MNHNDNPDFIPQPDDENIAAEVTEETVAEVTEAPAEEAAAEVTEAPAEEAAAEVTEPAEAAPAADAPKRKKGLVGWIVAAIAIVALIVVFVLDGRNTKPAADPDTTVPTETGAPADAPETPDATGETAVDITTLDFDTAYAKYAPDTVVFTVNGKDVTWDAYYCWLYNVITEMAYTYGITDWTMPLDETLTAEDYVWEATMNQSSQYPMIYGKAEELGVALDDEDMAQIDAIIASDISLYYEGDKDAFLAELESLYITEEYYRSMGGASFLYEKLFAHFFGEDASLLSDEDALAFLTDNEFLHAKHILFKTVDSTNQPLEDIVIAKKLAQAEAVLAELKALPAEGFEEAFDAIVAEQSEDPGSISYPNGYYFQTGEMVESFETTSKELEVGEFSDIVESPYGYHILYRPEMRADDLFEYDNVGNGITVRYAAASTLFSNIMADWVTNMEIEFVPEFENLSLNTLFDIQ